MKTVEFRQDILFNQDPCGFDVLGTVMTFVRENLQRPCVRDGKTLEVFVEDLCMEVTYEVGSLVENSIKFIWDWHSAVHPMTPSSTLAMPC